MSVSTTNVFNESVAGGGFSFPFTFYCRSTSWLTVLVDQVVSGIWNATLNADQSANPGGSVTFTGPTPPTGGAIIRIERHVPVIQPDVYGAYTPFPAQTVEYDFDRAVCIMQEMFYLLSTLLLIPPINSGTAGQYLSNDGSLYLWADPVPRPYVPGWVLGAADPTTLEWVPGGTGGGGGITTIAPPTVALPYGAIITGISGNVLALGVADETHPGILSTAIQHVGGQKNFHQGAAVAVYDVRNFGAIANSKEVANDICPIIQAIRAQATADGVTIPTIYFPTGIWYTGDTITFNGLMTFVGDGPKASIISTNPNPGVGEVPAFSGPVIFCVPQTGYSHGYLGPGYAAALVGTGNSLVVGRNYPLAATFLQLNQAAAMNLDGLSQFSVQWWAEVDSITLGGFNVFGSSGQLCIGIGNTCLRVLYENQGGGLFLNCELTTTSGYYNIYSSGGSVTASTPLNFEIDYNGSFLDIYQDGINLVHQALTGTLVQKPWENVQLGGNGYFGPNSVQEFVPPYEGKLDSFRISNVARHTGTGSFTPPADKYDFDANTLLLFNFDQPLSTTSPWVEGLVQHGSPGNAIKINAFYFPYGFAQYFTCERLGINPQGMGQGLYCANAPWGVVNDVEVTSAYKTGFAVLAPESFYWRVKNASTIGTIRGFGMDHTNLSGNASGLVDVGSMLGISLTGGTYTGILTQPIEDGTCISGLVCRQGNGIGNVFSILEIHDFGPDYEGNFSNLLGGIVIDATITNLTVFNTAITTVSSPPILFCGSPWQGTVFDGCSFATSSATELFTRYFPESPYAPYAGPVVVRNSPLVEAPNTPNPVPFSRYPGFVIEEQAQQRSNQIGLSASNVQANNLVGTFTIMNGYTSGGPIFAVPEVDGNYIVNIAYKGYAGSAPAAGSTTVGTYTTRTDGFTMDQGTDPASDSITIWTYVLVRTNADPLLWSYLPSIPDTITNPLVGVLTDPPGDFAVGVTLVPAGYDELPYNTGDQTVVQAGTASPNIWQLRLRNQVTLHPTWGAYDYPYDSFVKNGQLYGLFNPGVHNVAIAVIGGQGFAYVDGQCVNALTPMPHIYNNPANYGTALPLPAITQAATISIGETPAHAESLVAATLRNLKIDTQLSKVITREPDTGPGAMDQAAFFGDEWTIGANSTAAAGGWASQIQTNRYGTTYYWGACYREYQSSQVASFFWTPWGDDASVNAPLVGMCLFTGFWDIASGATAASTWATIDTMLEGGAAYATWTPPLGPSFPPWTSVSPQAWAELYLGSNNTAASGTVDIGAVTFPWSIAANAQIDMSVSATACANLTALINADPSCGMVAQPVIGVGPPGQSLVILTAIASGTGGNGIVVAFASAASNPNAFSLLSGSALSVIASGGVDSICTIDGIDINTNFDTDANTTVNNLIADIVADGTLNALVTATNTGNGTMLLTANAPGLVGNAITIATNITGYSHWTAPPGGNTYNTTMWYGYNGAVQNGVGTIVLCTVPPFGDSGYYTVGKETQRNLLNTTIRACVLSGVVLADVDVTLRDAGDHTKIDPTYLDTSDHIHINDAGHTALYGLIEPLLP